MPRGRIREGWPVRDYLKRAESARRSMAPKAAATVIGLDAYPGLGRTGGSCCDG